ncbi:MAG: NTPase [Candidatus Hodarchaeota archaeon]
MNKKILITGLPRSGKSTLIVKLIEYFSDHNYTIHGFLTPEVRKEGNRIGFDFEDVNSKEIGKLARIGNYNTKYKLGRYCIFIEEFENLISKLENLVFHKRELLVIDEIGKMELFSKKFQNLITNFFSSNIKIIATIGQRMQHPLKDFLLKMPEVVLFTLTRQNHQEIFKKIIAIIAE